MGFIFIDKVNLKTIKDKDLNIAYLLLFGNIVILFAIISHIRQFATKYPGKISLISLHRQNSKLCEKILAV